MAAGLWNASDKHASVTLSEGDRRAGTGADWYSYGVRAVTSKSSGKFYFEILNITSTYNHLGLGNASESLAAGTFLGKTAYSIGWRGNDGKIWFNSALLATATWADGAVLGFAVDFDAGTIACYLNNVLKYTATVLPDGDLFPMASLCYNSGARLCQLVSEQAYTVPAGFTAWGEEPNVYPPAASLTLTPQQGIQIFPMMPPASQLTLTPYPPTCGQFVSIDNATLTLTPLAPTPVMTAAPLIAELTMTPRAPSYVWAIPANQRPAAQIIYTCTLTGDGESPALDDLDLPMSSFQGRMRDGEASYLSCVIPNATDYEEDITARQNGDIVVKQGYKFSDGTMQLEEIARVDFETLAIDQGARSASATIVGHRTTTSITVKDITVEGVSYYALQANTKRRIRAKFDTFLRIGDNCIYGTGDSDYMTVGYISYIVDTTQAIMEVTEA